MQPETVIDEPALITLQGNLIATATMPVIAYYLNGLNISLINRVARTVSVKIDITYFK
ncbi:MAG: hypothetical protein ACTS8H_04690 [Arsenophonus sp. NC-PE1-MAG3]